MASKKQREEEALLASHWARKWKEAVVAKSKYTKEWNTYFDAYRGDYFRRKGLPDYKSNSVSNYIFSIIETIRPIMLDNDPKYQAMPRHQEGLKVAEDLNLALSYEWDREGMNRKLYRELINGLVTGNYIFFLPWDTEEKQVKAIPVNPFNFFPDALAKDIESAEFIIYADYFNEMQLKRKFPDRASELKGGAIKHTELVGEAEQDTNDGNQILILEIYSRDHKTCIEDDKGKKKLKYPKGRITTVAPELGLILEDKENPYKDGKFPFVHGKDYDVPNQFWGEGEVAQLLSPQTTINELNNAIVDNAKNTANMPWIIDKSAGIEKGAITSRPGLIIRKNQGAEVRREQPPAMPAYVNNAVTEAKHDMEQISGIFDTLKGNSETGVYTAQGILALQEAGQARIRLKVKLMEDMLARLGQMWFSRMQQFWKEDRFVRIIRPDGTYDFKMLTKQTLQLEYDIRIMAGSTMAVNRNAMLDLMIRLAQTQMPDGQSLVDREAVVEFLPQEVKTAVLRNAEQGANAFQGQLEEITAFVQEQAQASQQFQQEMTQTIQQLTQEMQKNDQQTMQVIENIVKSLEKINGEIVTIKQQQAEKEQAVAQEEERSKLYDDAYNEGFRDAEQQAKSFYDEPLDESVGEGLDEGIAGIAGVEEPEMEMPEEMLQGLEALSEDELSLLMMADPSVEELI